MAVCHRHIWRPRRDSNSQPTDSKSGALSIELRGQLMDGIISLRLKQCQWRAHFRDKTWRVESGDVIEIVNRSR
jgi:hypothetical protein